VTKAEACRAIAERLEPKPNGVDLITRDEMIRHNKTGIKILSPKGFWWWHGKVLDWSQFDPFTSEEASARLLEAMPAPDLYKCWLVEEKHYGWSCSGHTSSDRKTAIVLAAMKWLGIDGELEAEK